MKLVPYLTFLGNAEKAMHYYKKVFNADIPYIKRYGDTPMESFDESCDKVLHGVLTFNDNEIYFSDGFDGMEINKGENILLTIEFDSYDEILRVYNEMKDNGIVKMDLQDSYNGTTFACILDKYGINWNLNFDSKTQ
jgi:PhnB protein